MGKRDNVIEIRGIVRNTKSSGTRDGESEELVGMRLKDDSWRPVGALRTVEGSNGLVNGLRRVWVHRNRYAHVLAVDASGRLVWAGDVEDGEVVAFSEVVVVDADVVTDVASVVVTQTGHLVAVKSSEYGMRYYMYRTESGAYDNVAVDFNTVRDYGLLPYGSVDFKVERVEDEDGRAVWFGDKIEDAGIVDAEADSSIRQDEVMYDVVSKTRGCVKKVGYFTGAFMVCTAAELYDGTYILMSKPTLLCSPGRSAADKMGGMNTDVCAGPSHSGTQDAYGNMVCTPNTDVCDSVVALPDEYGQASLPSVGKTTLNDIRGGKMNLLEWMHSKRAGLDFGTFSTYAVRARQEMKEWDYDKEAVDDSDFTAYSCDVWSAFDFYGVNNQVQSLGAVVPRLWVKNLRPLPEMYCFSDTKEDDTFCYTTANKLMFKVNNLVSKEYKDVIRNISVFITREVEMLEGRQLSQKDAMYESPVTSSARRRIVGYQWNYRDHDKILKELIAESLMYKIGEIDVDGMAESDIGQWKELEIEEGVLANLVSQDRLKVDSVGRDTILPRVAFPYNGRLHLANYEERMFEGWLLKDFFHWGGSGQYGYTVKNLAQWDNVTLDGWIKVRLEDSEAERTVVRRIELKYVKGGIAVGTQPSAGSLQPMGIGGQPTVKLTNVPARVQSLGPMLSYPDKRAKEMEIYLRDRSITSGNNVFHKTVSLEAHDWYDMAYWVNEDFKPVDITYTESNSGTLTLPEEENVSEVYTNRMKVSRVDNPLFFPNEYVYTVGNGEIVGLAANAETLAGGQIGDAPLYVMCSDGVYGMFVDSTGQFAYSNSRVISRYVCNNAQGIRAILGGVAMPTEWGLVVLNGLKGEDVSDAVEGEPFGVQSGLPEAWKCIGHRRLVELQALVGGDFVEFLKGAIIGFCHYRRELWVMGGGYSYVLGETGGWTKRRETGVQLVEDFPNLYLLDSAGRLFDLQREDETEATECMVVGRMVKADTQEFKQTERMIVRGEFKVPERSEVARLVELEASAAAAKLDKVWVVNPTITTLTQRSGLEQVISGSVAYEKRYAVCASDSILKLDDVSGIDFSTSEGLRDSLAARSEMMVSGVKKTVWTSLTGVDTNYPQFRFDQAGEAMIRFGSVCAVKVEVGGVQKKMFFPDGWEGLYSSLVTMLDSGSAQGVMLYKSGSSSYGLLEYELGSTGVVGTQEQIGDALGTGKNYKVWLMSGTGTARVQTVGEAWLGGSSAVAATTGCQTLAAGIINKSGNWEMARMNNTVTLAEGNVRSADGALRFSVTAAQAGQYAYYEVEENVADGTFGLWQGRLSSYQLSAGTCYRLGANGAAWVCVRGGSWTWVQLQVKVATEDGLMKVDVATGSDTVALTQYGCYWFRFGSVVASESVEVKVRYVGASGTYTITQVEGWLSDTSKFETITDGKVDVGGERSLTLTVGEIVKARWMSGATAMEKVVKVTGSGTTVTKTIAEWRTWFAAAEEYEMTEGDEARVGLYLFGSYDGYKWKMLGARERGGEFRDLGLEAHRVDCKYFRLVMCGKLLAGSSVEYVEQQVKEKLYRGKIR